MTTRDESIDMAPAVPPELAVKLARRICTVEFLMFMLPGTPVTSESTKATFNVSVISRMAALLGDAAETVTPPNFAENLHARLGVTVCCPSHPLVSGPGSFAGHTDLMEMDYHRKCRLP